MLGLRVKHRVIGAYVNIEPFAASKKSLHQFLLNGGFIAKLPDVVSFEIGATWHGRQVDKT